MNVRINVHSPMQLKRSLLVRMSMLLALLVVAVSAHAQEVTVFAGRTAASNLHSTYAFQVEYMEDFTDNLSYSFNYRNDGHFPNNHRDGMSLGLWYRTNLFFPNLYVQTGAGPYFYADTVESVDRDLHGVAADFNAALVYETNWGLSFQLRGDDTLAFGRSLNTFQALLGVGYRLDETRSPFNGGIWDSFKNDTNPHKDSWSLLAGKTVVNIRTNGRSNGEELEYRHELSRWIDVSVGAINEGDSQAAHRFGLAPEVWLKKNFYNDRLSMGIGTGVYAGHERLDIPNASPVNGAFVAGIVSATASFQLFDKVSIRAIWHRPTTRNNSDSDLWFFGLQFTP